MKKKGIHTALGNTTGNVNRLMINSFGRDDAGKYRCRASDKAGQSDTKTTVIKMEGITISQHTVAMCCLLFSVLELLIFWCRSKFTKLDFPGE